MINKNWERDFYDFMRQTRVVSEDTIETYLEDAKRIAASFGDDVLSLVKNQECYDRTVARIMNHADWSDKTKSNYMTAYNRMWAFSKFLLSKHGMRDTCSDGVTQSPSPETRQIPNLSIMDQANRQGEYAREKEDSVCRLIFGLVSAYVLAMPAILVNSKMTVCALVVAAISVIAGFASLFVFIPLLRRPCRHAKTIEAYGEELVFEKKSFGWIRPVDWSHTELWSMLVVAVLVGISVVGFMVALVVNRAAQ